MAKQRKILIYASLFNEKICQNLSYLSFFSNFGDVVLVHALNDFEFWLQHGDVLALPGGSDVDATRYGGTPLEAHPPNPGYEYLDKHLLEPWILTGKPIVGICRGLQTLNVSLGGTLYQDIRDHVGYQDKRDTAFHRVYTDIENLNGEDFRIIDVNSYHHQAIKKLADGFEVIGWSTLSQRCLSALRPTKEHPITSHIYVKQKDTNKILRSTSSNFYVIPEIIKHRELPYIGFQYHPEDLSDPLTEQLIEEVLS